MSSFEVHYDDVIQKIRELEGAKNAKNDHINPLLNVSFLLFVLHHHDVPQKDIFHPVFLKRFILWYLMV